MLTSWTRTSVVLGVAGVLIGFWPAGPKSDSLSPETVEVAPRAFNYRLAGEFYSSGAAVDAPAVAATWSRPLRIMKRQVTAGEYRRCVFVGRCKAPFSNGSANLPAVNVSWDDATAYARWLSGETGHSWRLPTDEEWAFAAGSRFHDDALRIGVARDPSARWLARYQLESTRDSFDRSLREAGGFGENEYGLLDLSGNVWEWTDSCFIRRTLDADGAPFGAPVVNCGVRVVEGEHRAYVPDFVRDANAGGCAAGSPPSNLGFRLVRDDAFAANVKRLRNSVGGLVSFRS